MVMSETGLRMMGKDPEGKARAVNVNDCGASETQITGINKEIATSTKEWSEPGDAHYVDIPDTNADLLMISLKNNSPFETDFGLELQHRVGDDFIPWHDGEGNRINVNVKCDTRATLGPYRGLNKFDERRVKISIPDSVETILENKFVSDANIRQIETDEEGNIYFSRSGILTKLDKNMNLLWEKALGLPVSNGWRWSFRVAKDKIYCIQDGAGFVIVNLNGDIIKEYEDNKVGYSIAYDNQGNIFYTRNAEGYEGVVKVTPDFREDWAASTGDSGTQVSGVEVTKEFVFVTNILNNTLYKINKPTGSIIDTVVLDANAKHPVVSGDIIYVPRGSSGHVDSFDFDLNPLGAVRESSGNAEVDDVKADTLGYIYYIARDENIRKIDPDGNTIWIRSDILQNRPETIHVDKKGNIYVGSRDQAIFKIRQGLPSPFTTEITVREV